MGETRSLPIVNMPQITLVQENDLNSPLPLEHTAVHVQVTGPIASVVVVQRFGNPLEAPAELDYLLPLPEDAAITGFELRIGARRITGDLQEIKAAQQAYETAREAGKRAGLFEQRRPNLYALRLANIQPGEVIHSTIRYQQRVKIEDGRYTFVYPMGITPKYNNPAFPQEAEGTQAPIRETGEQVGPVEINLAVDAGVAVGEINSPSHPLEVVNLDERRFQVRLAGEQIPDHDFVLHYSPAGESVQAVAWTSGAGGQEIFLATLVPPSLEEEALPYPREFIFVLDRSGSMYGEPIAQARNALRACLRTLSPGDTFRILLFDNYLEWFQKEPSTVTQQAVEAADAYLSAVEGRGGTEIVEALEAALSLREDPERTRFVIFLTDGAVSAEARALEQIRRKIGTARLFTFGIGPSVNRALLSRMAVLGRGSASFLQLNEDIEGAIIRFQDSVSFPVVTGLSLSWAHTKAWDVYPVQLSDLYYGQPLEICGRLSRQKKGPAELVLRGLQGSHPFELRVSIPAPTMPEPAIERLWAQARLSDLLDQQALEPARAERLRAEVVGLALEHDLVTAYTAFAAVDEDPTQGGKARTIHISQPLPQGLTVDAFAMPVPQAPPNVLPSMVSPAMLASMPMPPSSAKQAPRAKMARESFSTGAVPPPPPGLDLPKAGDREAALRWLARTQKLDGSWQGSLEMSAAALLAFVRAGHTTRAGSFRQVVRRVVRWLVENPQPGMANYLRARALEELAKATGSDADRAASHASRMMLPRPTNDLELAACGETVAAPVELQTLDDLRLVVLLGVHHSVPENLLRGSETALAIVWAAALP